MTKATKLYVGDIVAVDECGIESLDEYCGYRTEGSHGRIIATTPPETGWKEKLYYVALVSGKRVWAAAKNLKLIEKGDKRK